MATEMSINVNESERLRPGQMVWLGRRLSLVHDFMGRANARVRSGANARLARLAANAALEEYFALIENLAFGGPKTDQYCK